MKILHTISGFGIKSGGPSTCVYDLLSSLHSLDCPVDLLTFESSDPLDPIVGNKEDWIKVLHNDKISAYGYSKNLNRYLNNNKYDIYHANGLWTYCSQATCNIAQSLNKPYVITPHGMLYPGALRRSYWKKWLLMKMCVNNNIQRATVVHATCMQELEYIRKFGYTGQIALIPNPVLLPNYISEIHALRESSIISNKPQKLGFLGRLHPVKKIENLLYGMANMPKDIDCELVIMGKGDCSYERFLHDEICRLGLKNVTFTGFVKGREKFERLSELAALFVPSEFENFGMIVTESLSVGTPVMASLGTPWEDLNRYNCGWWIDCNVQNITQVMLQALTMSSDELIKMGRNGRMLVAQKYDNIHVASQMLQLYSYICDGGSKPDFVFV